MPSYDVQTESPATPDDVFAVLQDLPGWTHWQQFDSVECLNPGPEGPDSAGAVWALRKKRLDTQVQLTGAEPGRQFSYRMLSEQWARDYQAMIELRPSMGGTRIRWRATFQPRIPGTGRLWEWALQREMSKVVQELARYSADQS